MERNKTQGQCNGCNDTLTEKFQISSSKEAGHPTIAQIGNVASAGAFAKKEAPY